jgi:hypothetical protein
MRNIRDEDKMEFYGKTMRKKPRIGVLHTKREEKPTKRILKNIKDEEEALREVEEYLYGEYDA